MRIGMLQATGDMEGEMHVFTFAEQADHPEETIYVSFWFMAHFDALHLTKPYAVQIQDHEGILERCILLGASLVCSFCDETYTELLPLETSLLGNYCSEECVYNAEAFEDAMASDK